MKRAGHIFFAVAVMSLAISPVHAASSAPKLGAACTKIGALSTVPTTKARLICQAKGKKLFWASYVQPGNAPMSTPTSASAPAAVIDPIRQAAFDTVHSMSCSSSHPHIAISQKIVGTHVPMDVQALINPEFERVMDCFDGFFDTPINLSLIYVTEKDSDILASQVPNIIGQQNMANLQSVLTRYASNAWGPTGGPGGGIGGKDQAGNYFLVIHMASYTNASAYALKGVMHEFTHILQNYGRRNAHTSTQADWYANMPGYFVEGGAEALAYIFTSTSVTSYNSSFAQSLSGNTQAYPTYRHIADLASAITLMKTIEFPNTQATKDVQYPYGSIICEYILGKYGIAKFLDLIKGTSNYPLWADNLKTTLGVSQEDFYQQALTWALPVWNAEAA
jgi:hypothetical protein